MTKPNRHILIIGGMGPQASLYAHQLILEEANRQGAVNNEDYPRITHISVSVRDFISEPTYRDEARDYIISCIKEFDTTGVDRAFIACNTAHILFDEIQTATGLPLTSLIDVTLKHISGDRAVRSVGIIATPSTLSTGLYSKGFGKYTKLVEPTLESSKRIETIIRDVIGGKDEALLAALLQKEMEAMYARGADKVVMGCTETSLLAKSITLTQVVDPLSLTIREIMR